MGRRREMPSMDMPKHWVYRVCNALTVPMQRHLWASYSDLVSLAVPDTAPPASTTWSLTLGRRVFASDEAGSSSQNTSAGMRGATVTPGTLQHHASSPAARGAALRFMATLDLLLGGAGEGRGRIEQGPLTPAVLGPSPAPAWGGWGGKDGLTGSPRDMCARVDFSSLHTARVMQCVPGADGKQEIDPAEIDAAANAVRTRCGVHPDVDIVPFRLGGLGTCVTIEVGSDEEWKMCEGYDEGYAFYMNLRPPNSGGWVDFYLAQLGIAVPLTPGDLLGFRSAVQLHCIKDNNEDAGSTKKKKKKGKKKKKAATSAQVEDNNSDGESDVDDLAEAVGATTISEPSAAGSSRPSAAAGSSRAVFDNPASSFQHTAGSSSSAAASSSALPSSSSTTMPPVSASAPISKASRASSTMAARSTPPPSAATTFSSMPRIMVTIWTDIETVANVAMAAKLVWPELQIAGIDSPPPSPTLSAASGKRPARF